jgi:hypothetical protein
VRFSFNVAGGRCKAQRIKLVTELAPASGAVLYVLDADC